MSAEIIRFPTRSRKAFRHDWLEMKGLPHNCYEFKGRHIGLYRNLKGREWNLREMEASFESNASDLLREINTRMQGSIRQSIGEHFGYTGDAA